MMPVPVLPTAAVAPTHAARLPSVPAALRRRALDGELFFYGRALGFAPVMPPDFEPIAIENA